MRWMVLEIEEGSPQHLLRFQEKTEALKVPGGILLRTSSWVRDESSMARALLFIPSVTAQELYELAERESLWDSADERTFDRCREQDEYPHYQDRVEMFEVAGGLVVRTMFWAWTEESLGLSSDYTGTEALAYIPGVVCKDLFSAGQSSV